MEFRQFEAFLVVAEELHFRRAAERLHLGQPALSRLIKALEKEIGVDLFERTTRKVRLTSSGEALLEPAREIQMQINHVGRIAKSAQLGDIGSVKVGFAGTTGYSIVSTLARETARRHPGITLQLHPRSFSGESLTLLREGEMDLAVVSPPAPAGISTHLVSDEELLVAVPSDHRLASRSKIDISQLKTERFISYPVAQGSRVGDAMAALCIEAGFMPDIAQEAPDPYSLLALVGAGVGVAVVVGASRNVQINGVTYLPVAGPRRSIPIAVGWRDSNPSFALRRVIDLVRECLPSPPLR